MAMPPAYQRNATREMTPREQRQQTVIEATMTGEFTPQSAVTIRDISQFGIGAATKGDLPDIGEHVVLSLTNGGEVSGKVRWTDGHKFGLRLNKAFDLGRLNAINQLRSRVSENNGPSSAAIEAIEAIN